MKNSSNMDKDKPLKTPVAFSDALIGPVDKSLIFKGMEVHVPKKSEITKTATDLRAGSNTVKVNKVIKLVDFSQDPYTDIEKQRFEGAMRKSYAVKAAFAVRKHFMFGKGSELQIVLDDYEIGILDQKQKDEKIQRLKDKNADLLKALEKRDNDVKLKKTLPVFMEQRWGFGRGAMIKWFQDETSEEVKKLQALNSRRLQAPIYDIDNNNSFEGVIIDNQGLSKDSVIYAPYNEDELSPHTEGYGYSELEAIAHVAETLNILLNEDIKEISKSAWLASILLSIDTAGLTSAEADAKIKKIVKAVAKAGKIVGVNTEVIAQQMKLDADLDGLTKAVEKEETIIFKSLGVPQFLVQSEAAANYATAGKAAQLFIDGQVADDQRDLEDVLQAQWYDPYLEANRLLLQKNDEIKPNDKQPIKEPEVSVAAEITEEQDEEALPFHVRRVFNKAKVSEFVDLAQSVVSLKNAGIWDVEKANEVLDSEEVTERVNAQNEEKMKNDLEMAKINADANKGFQDQKLKVDETKAKALEKMATAAENASHE